MDSSNAIGLLGAHAAPVLTALAAVTLALLGVSRWRHRLRVNAEHAAALALIRAHYTLREALSDCRSHIIESGKTPPGLGSPLDSMIAADAAVREALPAIVGRYRSAGVLTWALLHQIEAEVLADLASTGQRAVPLCLKDSQVSVLADARAYEIVKRLQVEEFKLVLMDA
jgi:hypothetical protein